MERNTIDLVVTEETHKNDASSFVRVVHTGETDGWMMKSGVDFLVRFEQHNTRAAPIGKYVSTPPSSLSGGVVRVFLRDCGIPRGEERKRDDPEAFLLDDFCARRLICAQQRRTR